MTDILLRPSLIDPAGASNDDVLTIVGGVPEWAAPGGGGGGGFNPNPVDDPANWTLLGSYAYEFGAASSSLPSGWSWFNQGSATYSESLGAGVLDHPGSASDNVKGIVRDIPSESSWVATMKCTLTSVDSSYVVAGPILSDGTKATLFGLRNRDSGSQTIAADDWSTGTSYSGTRISPVQVMGAPVYFRIRKNSSTSWDWAFSQDGVAWRYLLTASNITGFQTPTKIGFGILRAASSQSLVACHWFRVTS